MFCERAAVSCVRSAFVLSVKSQLGERGRGFYLFCPRARPSLCWTLFRERERDCFYYIIIQTYEVGLHSRRHPIEIDAGTNKALRII